MNHQMRLHPAAFELIKSGKKDLEVRLYDEKRRGISLGDTITFSKRPNLEEKVTKKVSDLIISRNFNELFRNIPGIRGGWKLEDTPEKMSRDMERRRRSPTRRHVTRQGLQGERKMLLLHSEV